MAVKKGVKGRKIKPSAVKTIKTTVANSKVVSATIGFKKKDVKIMDRGRYKSLLISRGAPPDEPGSPAIPWKKYYLAVPWDAVPGKLSVTGVKTAKLARKIQIEPCQADEPPVVGRIIKRVPPDEKVYSSKSAYPKNMVRVGQVKRYRGFALAEIEVCPFRYFPKSGQLDMIQSLNLSLKFTRTKKERKQPNSMAVYKHEEKCVEYAKKKVLNKDDVEGFRTFRDVNDDTDLTSYPNIDYVIITSSELAPEFQRLAEWRTRLGLLARVVTVEDILAGTVPDTEGKIFWETSGYPDGGTRDTAEAIRNFIKWAAVHWLMDYVVLGGDTEVIPVRQALHTKSGDIDYFDINNPAKKYDEGVTISASSTKPGCGFANVLDEDEDTVWECDSGDGSPWIQMAFDSKTYVNGVTLAWGAQGASSYAIRVSDNGATWTTVWSTTSGAGGDEQPEFDCIATRNVRLSITGGTDFSLAEMWVRGPTTREYGTAYQLSPTVTRFLYESASTIQPNPTNSIDENTYIIREGPQAGKIIPYDTAAGGTALGWRFVEDLQVMPGAVSSTSTRFVEVCGPAQYHGQPFAVKLNHLNYIPTDLYYADIAESEYVSGTAHDWDADNNGIYGERYGGEVDGVNGLEDIYVGRAPVETMEETAIFIDKLIRYERFTDKDGFLLPSDFAVSVLLGSKNLLLIEKEDDLDISAAGKEAIRAMLIDYDSNRWKFTRLYQDYEDVPVADQTSDLGPADTSAILQAITDGNNVASLTSHGNAGYLCYMVRDDIAGVVSHPAVFFGNSCSTNQFDLASGEAFSEVSMLNPDGAAVAYVGNSRYGRVGDGPVELAFWEEMLYSGLLGEMFNQCKTVKIGWQSYVFNLLGDPAMRVWSDRPLQLNVTHASETCTGHQNFRVDVTYQGQPVDNALVCASMEGTMHVTGTTGGSGSALLTIAPSVEGTMHVTVSGKNLIPYLGTVNVEKARINCIPLISCTNVITCNQLVSCGKSITCKDLVACGLRIACKADIACKSQIMCTKSINCAAGVTCGVSIICGQEIICGAKIACGIKIGCPLISDPCPRILPKEFDETKETVRDIWGVQDVARFVKDTGPEKIEKMVAALPKEMQKSVRMMFDRIRKEQKVK